MSDTILSVDIGTTSLKAALITAQGEVVSFCSVSYEDSHDRFIACSWYGAFLQAFELLVKTCDVPGICIAGICISGNGPTVVTDCGLTFSWNEDTSAVSDCIPEIARTSLFIPKILSVKNQFPEIWKKAKKIFSGPEYLIYVLTGSAVTILPEARFLPAYWNDEVCKACGIKSDLLAPFVNTGALCGNLNGQVFEELKNALYCAQNGNFIQLNENCPVFAGGPDFVVALIGTGTLENGKLCDRCGSSEGLNFCTKQIVKGKELRTLPSVISGLWNVSYLIPESGTMSDEQRLCEVEKGIAVLKDAAYENQIEFPACMAVTGGQSNDELLLKEKNERLGMKLLLPGEKHFVHSELLGDACAGWFGLGVYDSLQAAAKKIVRLRVYENL
ncbi:MAG: hypothetical protein J6X84_05150 [Treponema sp.]|nr:hypothetical protein [Treponema sp.]